MDIGMITKMLRAQDGRSAADFQRRRVLERLGSFGQLEPRGENASQSIVPRKPLGCYKSAEVLLFTDLNEDANCVAFMPSFGCHAMNAFQLENQMLPSTAPSDNDAEFLPNADSKFQSIS